MIIISRPRKLARTPTYYYYTKFKWIVTLIIVYQHFCKVVEKRGELKMKVVCQFNFDQHFQMLTFLMVLINLFAKFSPNFSWAEMVFNVDLTPPNHLPSRESISQAVYAKHQLSVFRSFKTVFGPNQNTLHSNQVLKRL